MYFCGGRLALEQFHLSVSVLADHVVRCPATSGAKPFLKLGIPSDVMFHSWVAIAWQIDSCQSETARNNVEWVEFKIAHFLEKDGYSVR
jgi:hypothetical protein